MSNIVRIAQYDNSKGLTAKQAVDTANQRKVILLTNKDFDQRLVKTDTWKGEKEVYPAWTGTQVAYAKKNEKAGNFIEYTDSETNIRYVFEAGDAKGEKNVILAINHGFTQDGKPLITYNMDGENTVLVQIAKEAKVDIIPNFPTSDNWYLADSKFGIPVGERVDSSNDDARHLYRLDNGYVGLLARVYDDLGYVSRRDVYAYGRPSGRFGVLGIEAASGKNGIVPREVQELLDKVQELPGEAKKKFLSMLPKE